MFIVIEGPDAVGKHTQAELLAARLKRMVSNVLSLAFPRYDTPLGQAILRHLKREIAMTCDDTRVPEDALVFQCMMSADKYHAAPMIVDYLQLGGVVICDRWWQSAYVYGTADGLPAEWLLKLHERLPMADVNILIDLPMEEALKRRPLPRDRYEEDLGLREKVATGYRNLWHANQNRRWCTVDGHGEPEEIGSRILSEVAKRR